MAPTDEWQWDAEAGEVVALDVNGDRYGEAVSVDFTDEPVGVLAAAAPDMARDLIEVRHFLRLLLDVDPAWLKYDSEALRERITSHLRKAGVL